MEKNKQLVVEGVLEWAHLEKPNEMSNKFQVDVCQLSKDAVKELKAAGLDVQDGAKKGKEGKGFYITPKATRPVTIVDSMKNSLACAGSIGNGTEAKVAVRPFDYNYKGKSGVGVGLQAIQILKLVEYSAAGMFEEESGYTAPQPVAAGGAETDPFDDDVPM